MLGRSLLVGAIASAVVAGSAAGAMAAPKSAVQGGDTAVTSGSSATGVADAGPARGRAWS